MHNQQVLCIPKASSILSHSSRMKCFRCFRLRALLLAKARIRPGVPTTMCGQLVFRVCSSFLIGMPPKNTAILTPFMYLLKRSYSLLIWNANSLVWQRTSTETFKGKKESKLYHTGNIPILTQSSAEFSYAYLAIN